MSWRLMLSRDQVQPKKSKLSVITKIIQIKECQVCCLCLQAWGRSVRWLQAFSPLWCYAEEWNIYAPSSRMAFPDRTIGFRSMHLIAVLVSLMKFFCSIQATSPWTVSLSQHWSVEDFVNTEGNVAVRSILKGSDAFLSPRRIESRDEALHESTRPVCTVWTGWKSPAVN